MNISERLNRLEELNSSLKILKKKVQDLNSLIKDEECKLYLQYLESDKKDQNHFRNLEKKLLKRFLRK